MTRVHDAHFTAIHVAQQARKEARAADHAYLTTPAERWQTGGNVAFDVPVAQPDQRAGRMPQRPSLIDLSLDGATGRSQPSPPITSGGVESRHARDKAQEIRSRGPVSRDERPVGFSHQPVDGPDKALTVLEAGVAPGPLTHQRPNPADCRTDRPSPAVPSVAAAGAPLYALVHYCRAAGLPEPVPEYRFHPTRMWRFDYAFPLHKIAVEIDGGVWTQGRHTRGAGYIADMEKMNAAAKLGWRVLKYTPQTLGVAIDDLRVVLT